MSKAHGKPLASFGWDSNDDALDKVSRSSLTLHQKQKVMKQLGKIHASLSNLRFDRIGSLLRVEDDYTLERCLSPALIWHGRDEFDESDIPLGPFDDAASFYRAQTLALLAHVRELPMEHHVFRAPVPTRQEYNTFSEYRTATDRWNDYVTVGSKIESATNRLEYTSAGLAILDFVPLLAERENQIISPSFPLFHPDLSTNNLFVDDDLNVTCIIDWACTSSVPKSTLLVCPGLPHSRNPPSLDCIASFKEGFLEGKGFDGQPALPFENSNDLWQFARLVNLDSIQDYDHFSKLFQSLAPGQELYTKLHDLKKRDEFINSLKVVSQYTATSEEIRNEKQYFECNGSERLALARHMTTMTNLNPRFVADQRLWKWVSIYLKERDTYMFPPLSGKLSESCENCLGHKEPWSVNLNETNITPLRTTG